MTEAYNMDCMELMKRYPDGYFDLAVVDPPYGGGGGKTQDSWSRFGGRFTRYLETSGQQQIRRTIRQVQPDGEGRSGGQKSPVPEQVADGRRSTLKKLWLGTTRQAKSISMNCFAFPSNRSSGAEITLDFRRHDAF